jgi:hypothetical protein
MCYATRRFGEKPAEMRASTSCITACTIFSASLPLQYPVLSIYSSLGYQMTPGLSSSFLPSRATAALFDHRAGELHTTTPPPSPPPTTPIPNDSEDDAGAVPSNLSPASRRLISKRLYMRRKRAEASGRTAQLDPARLKRGRKESATSKYRKPRPRGDGHGADDGEDPNSKQPERGHTRPYKIQHEFERLGIGADYLRESSLGLFHLGALGRLMRCVFCRSASCE